jgi:hypothetical protein
MRVDLLTTLAEILFEQRDLERAVAIHREILEHSVPAPIIHPPLRSRPIWLRSYSNLARMRKLPHSSAKPSKLPERIYERRGDLDSANRLFTDDLTWLLTEDPSAGTPRRPADPRGVSTVSL